MMKVPHVPIPGGRVHPMVVSKVASQDDNFTSNFISANTRVSPLALIIIASAIGLIFLLLALLG